MSSCLKPHSVATTEQKRRLFVII